MRKTSIEFEVNQNWIDFVLDNIDIFNQSCIGYWGRGIYHVPGKVWLVCDMESLPNRLTNEMKDQAINCLKDNVKLPEHFYIINDEVVIEAYRNGVRQLGENWYDHADSNDYDVALQKALFGKVVYG